MTIQVCVNAKTMKNLKKEAAKLGYLKEDLLKEDRFIVMWRRKDAEDLKKRGFDPEYPAFAPEAVK